MGRLWCGKYFCWDDKEMVEEEDHWLCESPLSNQEWGWASREIMCEILWKVRDEGEQYFFSSFFFFQNNQVCCSLNCKCVILSSVSGREKWRRNGNLYIHLYMHLNTYSQSVTLRRAHLAAAVSGNLWKSHRSRSGHTNIIKLQEAGVLHFVIQELSWCILILPIKKSHTDTLYRRRTLEVMNETS